MADQQTFVIVGASLAGASAARTLRDDGFDGDIHLVGAEEHLPYIRPPLSKDYLAGTADRASVFVENKSWYTDRDVQFHPGTRAVGLDLKAHRISTDDGQSRRYDRLLLTTGSRPRRLTVPGGDLGGVHYLRTLDHSEVLHTLLADGGKRLVVVGSGWIGMEVAATARTLGNEVTILERGEVPLAAALGEELGGLFATLHEEHGVVVRRSVVVEGFVETDGQVTGVLLAGGDIVPADLVVVGVGAVPNVELAHAAGLAVDNGILVDASLQTSDPHVFAAGDVANAEHPLIKQRLRNEHWANALNSGPVAARSMLGQNVSFDAVPYFYTDQFDLGMEYSGFGSLTRGADLVYRGNPASREFVVFWLNAGRVVAGMNVNVWNVNDAVQNLIRRGEPVDPARLADLTIALDNV
ncbi:MAG: FAD-dependent oxidoreductase [Cryobacterium sp.]|uniref:NAD(P)/FAD-dependent oxidoreductase n=1 Tax=unclassified Cryobacterium TaxID=2649013 RepID=UPI0018CA741B|nr:MULTISPECIES: FAD-dependent oxidoreductase [unclassified Cryobacterium]MCY7405574.1 FAD-dependent oxidoreductase [Cryobacterium sp.]MEC5154439.1 3-phenylpropionate/trans-cinnamate dioxygenase ferredoxin reductase subunit [Cryobacterium sp. CAN_C3]